MSTKILIVEDESLSAERLQNLIGHLQPQAQVLKITDSVKSTLRFLETKPQIDLGFFDIQLADGLSFEIFERITVPFPVIFTTAFNEYAIRAFKVNSIDYLLKPVDEAGLQKALQKYNSLHAPESSHALEQQSIALALKMLSRAYKARFLVRIGEHLRMIPTQDICLFYSMEKATFIRTSEQRDYAIDFSLDQLTELLDPAAFFRISRKYIVALHSITDIVAYSGNRLKLKLSVPAEDDILVSRDRVNDFKAWLNG